MLDELEIWSLRGRREMNLLLKLPVLTPCSACKRGAIVRLAEPGGPKAAHRRAPWAVSRLFVVVSGVVKRDCDRYAALRSSVISHLRTLHSYRGVSVGVTQLWRSAWPRRPSYVQLRAAIMQ